MNSLRNKIKFQYISGYGQFHWKLIFVCGLCIMTDVIENSTIDYMIPYIRCDLKCTDAQQVILHSISYLGIVISLLFWGIFADIWGRKQIIILSIVGTFLSSILASMSINVEMIIFAKFISGVLYV